MNCDDNTGIATWRELLPASAYEIKVNMNFIIDLVRPAMDNG